MQYVNDNMGEVFRRAAKKYPLNTNGADWNKIAEALQEDRVVETTSKKEGKHYNKFLLLLLFIPLPFLCNKHLKIGDNGSNEYSANKSIIIGEEFNKKEGSIIPIKPTEKTKATLIINKRITTPRSFLRVIHQLSSPSLSGKKEDIIKDGKLNSDVVLDRIDQPFKQAETTNITTPVLKSSNTEAIADDPEQNEKTTTDSSVQPDTHKEVITDKGKSEKNKKFYAGIVGGVDVTTVKFQKTKDAEYDIGILLGYDINEHWSLETGVLATKKFYYTDGEHFNSYKMSLPYNTKITAVDGNCEMIEVPIVAKYDFSTSSKKTWFATAGVSNLIMKKENYDYRYFYINSGAQGNYFKTYRNSSKDWVSIFQLSGGYNFNFKQIADIRFEPYIQLPIRGVGFGDLPLTSAGLRIAVTKKLF